MDLSSESWRAECEARWVMQQPKEARQAFYSAVREKRGAAAMDRLIEDVRRLWKESQGQPELFGS